MLYVSLIKIVGGIRAVFEIFLTPFHQLSHIINFLSGFLFGGIRLTLIGIGLKAIICDHSEQSKGERRNKCLTEFSLAISHNS